MRYLWAHIETILQQYDGGLPLSYFLKAYFKQHPRLGSRDRKSISAAVYAWYRCGKAVAHNDWPLKEKVNLALSLTGGIPKALQDGHLAVPHATALHDLEKTGRTIALSEIFPFPIRLSDGIDKDAWIKSLLTQPRLFLRTRKPQALLNKKLSGADIPFEWLSPTCLALPNGTKAEAILAPEDYWIMDASSQETGSHFHPQQGESWWDCCSGAGGKSLLLMHLRPDVSLTVSDIRESILQNLKSRFRQYHLSPPESIIADVADDASLSKSFARRSFDAIICDAPCTGSGTWARTPEGAYFFKEELLMKYAERQKAILLNAARYAKPGGRIIYITCSVFREENESVVEHALQHTDLQLESSGLINGITIGADCLFTAVLLKPE